MPIDPASGGTWIGVNDAGLCLTLLNVNPHIRHEAWSSADSARRPRSRGVIIPQLLRLTSVAEAVREAMALPPRDFPPFRLVLVDEQSVATVFSDGETIRGGASIPCLTSAPVMFTSSGLGDVLVDAPRRELFAEMFAVAGNPIEIQDRFHRHVWPDRTHLSVCMRRDDARTVSHTVVELRRSHVTMHYVPDAPDSDATATVLHLARDATINGN